MEPWRSHFLWLAVSAILAAHLVAEVESRFLTSVKHVDTTLQEGDRAVPAVPKERGLVKLQKHEVGTRKEYTAERLLEVKTDGDERSKPSVDGGWSTEFKDDGEKQNQTKDTVENNVENEAGKNERNEEKKAADEEREGEAVRDLLLWYLSPYLLPPPGQTVSLQGPVLPPLAHDAVVTPPVAPDFPNFSTSPSYPSFVLSPTLPQPPKSPLSTFTQAEGNETKDLPTQKVGIREAKSDRQTPQYFQGYPLSVWLHLIATMFSDEVYSRHIQRQFSPTISSDPSPPEAVEAEAQCGADPAELVKPASDGIEELPNDTGVKNVSKGKPLKPMLPLNPPLGFKMNKSMRPYVTTPIPVSPFYTFDKPPHFFPPQHDPADSEVTGTMIMEETLPADEPTAKAVGGSYQQADAPELDSEVPADEPTAKAVGSSSRQSDAPGLESEEYNVVTISGSPVGTDW